ncbi:hypothetical protein K469DRAFT_716977 [Zopfia rhizophila CBS 207.26]|uniref:NTF2-domain-containing protein n=1 Tax=Zopfia rhizophila CBS 207.26 TaxID=1314779 RepID=A0A6A6EMP9_9PEZI|nr:hypothetical protein K469DRAFT_716977 [Zopfia rhizophila CBS 207.26]
MATAEPNVPVNGNYAPQVYDAMANNYAAANANSTLSNSSSYGATQQAATSQSSNNASTSEIPKDEVGWYFVEQYYTTLSKSPEKLYLFYNKRSQFVSGNEEDKIQVCIGQKAINDQIKELDFHDTKVRVTNVDSQGSDANIVIQVIGEISNKGQPHKRFVQTFVLAEQTNGYFVLNDIFRYLAEEPEEEEEQLQHDPAAAATGVQEPAPTAAVPEAEPLNQSSEVANSEEDLVKVDQKLEDAAKEEPTREVSPPPAAVNGTPVPEAAEVVEAEETPAAAVSTEEAPGKETPEPTIEEQVEPEKPKAPTPTPAAVTPKPAPVATPSAPPKPAAPRTWASLAASANKVATPNVPAPVSPQAPMQPKAAAPAQSQPLAVPSAQTSTPVREPSPANSQGEASGWQTAGAGHKKEQSRAQNQTPAGEAENKRAYIKNVYSQVEEGSLRNVLSKFGDIEYLDISRQKNCAFVDFKTAAGFQNAVSNNPHTVNGLEIKVEERRLRPNSFAPYQRGGPRGRGGALGGQPPRGGFPARGGRGGAVGRGGRAAAQEV